MSLNQFTFVGRTTGDPEVRYSQGSKSTAIASFNIAVNRDFKKDGEPDADFFNCVAFGKTAEAIEKYVTKGAKLICVGKVQNNNYEKDGVKHYGFKVVIDKWEFAESKKAAAESQEQGPTSEQTPAKSSGDDFMPIPSNFDMEMPFA